MQGRETYFAWQMQASCVTWRKWNMTQAAFCHMHPVSISLDPCLHFYHMHHVTSLDPCLHICHGHVHHINNIIGSLLTFAMTICASVVISTLIFFPSIYFKCVKPCNAHVFLCKFSIIEREIKTGKITLTISFKYNIYIVLK